jgi:UDP-glucose 4-epimerase
MTVMVTGGTGFLGTYLVHHLVEDKGLENEVVVFDRLSAFRWPSEAWDRVVMVTGDVLELEELEAAITRYGVDRIVHFAFALGAPAPDRVVPLVRLQCMGTANVFEAARRAGVKRIVLGSSVAVYGPQPVDRLTEDLPCMPDALYGACKVFCEQLADHFTRSSDLEILTLRFGSVFGLGRADRGSYRSGLLAPRDRDFRANIELAVGGVPMVDPKTDAVADFCYGFDAAEAVWLALSTERPSHCVYNVTGEDRRISDFMSCVRRLLPNAPVDEEAERTGMLHPLLSTERIRADLGFVPRYTMESGLDDYLNRAADAQATARRAGTGEDG